MFKDESNGFEATTRIRYLFFRERFRRQILDNLGFAWFAKGRELQEVTIEVVGFYVLGRRSLFFGDGILNRFVRRVSLAKIDFCSRAILMAARIEDSIGVSSPITVNSIPAGLILGQTAVAHSFGAS